MTEQTGPCRTPGCNREDNLTRMTGPNGVTFICDPCYHAWRDGYDAGYAAGMYKERFGEPEDGL